VRLDGLHAPSAGKRQGRARHLHNLILADLMHVMICSQQRELAGGNARLLMVLGYSGPIVASANCSMCGSCKAAPVLICAVVCQFQLRMVTLHPLGKASRSMAMGSKSQA